MELSPSDRSLIYIKNNRGPRMNPCGTPALIGSQLDSWPFNNTLWILLQNSLQEYWAIFHGFQKIQVWTKVRGAKPCQRLWINPKIYFWCILLIQHIYRWAAIARTIWVMEINWLIQLSLERKPDWLIFRRFWHSRLLYIAFSKILPATWRGETRL